VNPAPAALVLAGQRGAEDPLARFAGVSHKAMIEIGGQPMLARVIAALAAAGIARVVVAIERPELVEQLRTEGRLPPDCAVVVLAPEAGPSASVVSALAGLGAPLLVTTADHALLRPEWVRWFLDHTPADADVAVALARDTAVVAAAPDTKRTFLRFADGAFSGCNLFYFATPAGARVAALWREVEAERKRPLRVIGRLAPATALAYALGLLSHERALARLGRLAAVKAAAVELPFGEAAIDVDKPADLALARRMVEG
jgi:GTP:adenosylcobinamide-phosphate guanylyltransferase